MRPPRRIHRLAWITCCLLVAVLAGCASGGRASTSSARATPTATPQAVTLPPVDTVALNGYMAAYVWPTAHGFVFTGNPGATGQQIGPAGSPALYYYDRAMKTVHTVASASAAADGTPRGIQDIATSGDWVSYLSADSHRSHWMLSALNLASGQSWPVASAPGSSLIAFTGTFVTDGAQVVWSVLQGQPNATHFVMSAFDLASGQSRTLMASTNAGPTSIVPVAIASGTLVYVKTNTFADANGGLGIYGSLWLWKLANSAPQQISNDTGMGYAMNDRYVVWDNAHAFNVTIYDRAAGKETGAVGSCIRPQLAQTRPYLVCVDFYASSYRLVRLPSGDSIVFYDHSAINQSISVSGDRACWVATAGSRPYGSAIQCFDMPAR